jgi:hypothetical protein
MTSYQTITLAPVSLLQPSIAAWEAVSRALTIMYVLGPCQSDILHWRGGEVVVWCSVDLL